MVGFELLTTIYTYGIAVERSSEILKVVFLAHNPPNCHSSMLFRIGIPTELGHGSGAALTSSGRLRLFSQEPEDTQGRKRKWKSLTARIKV